MIPGRVAALLLAASIGLARGASAAGAAKAPEPFVVFSLLGGRVDPAAEEASPEPVGSIQKAWVARAWAASHPDPAAGVPRFSCGPSSGCWNHRGHGAVGLRRATSLSCNTYFLGLAGEVPRETAERVFREAGFELRGLLSPERMVGVDTAGRPVTIRPRRLLESFRALLTEPWGVRDEVRSELIGGMRDSAEDGTGSLVPLPGVAVKTGTVASLHGDPLATTGWAIAADPTGETVRLALLRSGTGALAASRLAACWLEGAGKGAGASPPVRKSRAGTPPDGRRRPLPEAVRVRLFSALAPRRITATNVGAFPIRAEEKGAAAGWVGPGASRHLRPGVRLSPGAWELSVEPYRLVRVVRGSLDARDGLHPVLTASLRDWAEGVVRSEAKGLPPDRVSEFLPVVLRFLRRGSRHGSEDVCDLSHCARFSGFGPAVTWARPDLAVPESPPAPHGRPIALEALVSDAAWAAAAEASERPGPSLWSAGCGGQALTEREVWGSGATEPFPCERAARHGALAPWARALPGETLTNVFGRKVLSLEAVERDGVRKTAVTFADGRLELPWDDLHRRLSRLAGWDALPSPPDSWSADGTGWKAVGRGSGHRVGYCLGE